MQGMPEPAIMLLCRKNPLPFQRLKETPHSLINPVSLHFFPLAEADTHSCIRHSCIREIASFSGRGFPANNPIQGWMDIVSRRSHPFEVRAQAII
jgi:hypothetical protein